MVYDQPVILLIFYCFCKEAVYYCKEGQEKKEADLIDDEVLLHKAESRISIYDSLLWQERMHLGLSGNENVVRGTDLQFVAYSFVCNFKLQKLGLDES